MKQSLAAKEFIAEIVRVCNTYGFSLGHEDTQGSFIVEDFSPENVRWLQAAVDNSSPREPKTAREDLLRFLDACADPGIDLEEFKPE